MKQPFELVVAHVAGERVTYTHEAFFALPLYHRVQLLMARDLAFYEGEKELERRVVLRELMNQKGVPG